MMFLVMIKNDDVDDREKKNFFSQQNIKTFRLKLLNKLN